MSRTHRPQTLSAVPRTSLLPKYHLLLGPSAGSLRVFLMFLLAIFSFGQESFFLASLYVLYIKIYTLA